MYTQNYQPLRLDSHHEQCERHCIIYAFKWSLALCPKIQQPFYSYAYTPTVHKWQFFSLKTILELSAKSRNQGAKTASFGIIGHQNA